MVNFYRFLKFSVCMCMLIENKELYFILFKLHNAYSFYLCTCLFCLIALAKTSNLMLSRDSESKHHCLVFDLMEKTFSFSPLNVVKCRFYFLQIHFIRLRIYPFIPLLLRADCHFLRSLFDFKLYFYFVFLIFVHP